MLTDFITANIAFLLFDICRYFLIEFAQFNSHFYNFLTNSKILLEQGLFPLVVLGVYAISGFYNDPERRSRITELITTFLSAAVVSLLIYFSLMINDIGLVKVAHYKFLAILFGLFFIITYLGRYIITTRLFRSIRRGNVRFNTVIIGNSQRSRKVAQQLIRTQSLYGYNIIGFVPVVGESTGYGDVPLLSIDDLKRLVAEGAISDVIIALEQEDNEQTVLAVMNRLFALDISIKVAAGSFSYLPSGIRRAVAGSQPLAAERMFAQPETPWRYCGGRAVADIAASCDVGCGFGHKARQQRAGGLSPGKDWLSASSVQDTQIPHHGGRGGTQRASAEQRE